MVNDTFLFTCSALGQYFYSNGTTTDGCLYRYDTAADSIEQIYECNSYKPIVTGDNDVYYLDVNQNNALVHTNIRFDNPRTLSNDSIDLYNIYGSTIFYQNYSENTPALCMMKMTAAATQDSLKERIPISTLPPITSILPIFRQNRYTAHQLPIPETSSRSIRV